jgi:hypothetical protein
MTKILATGPWLHNLWFFVGEFGMFIMLNDFTCAQGWQIMPMHSTPIDESGVSVNEIAMLLVCNGLAENNVPLKMIWISNS